MWTATGPAVRRHASRPPAVLSSLRDVLSIFSRRRRVASPTARARPSSYAIGSGAAEGISVQQFLEEAGQPVTKHLAIFTDSTSGKSMATRIGVSRATKHIAIRYLCM